MSERIYAAVTENFIRRMRNWAKAGAGLLKSKGSISSIYRGGVRSDRYASIEPPLLGGEASDTDLALSVVPIRYRQAVQQFWSCEGQSLRWHAGHSRHKLTYETFEIWVMKGHELLVEELATRSAEYHSRSALNAARVQSALDR